MRTSRRLVFVVFFITILIISGYLPSLYAASLTIVRDLISTSRPSTAATHTISFTVTNAIPASGRIRITPQVTKFEIPPGLSYIDVDMSVSTGGPYTDRALAASATATDDGVAVISGTTGSITITLNSTNGISAGSAVRILLGTNASVGGSGNYSLINHSSAGSHMVVITTLDQSGVMIDAAQSMIAVVTPTTITVPIENVAPAIFNGLPSGTVAAGNTRIELSFETDEVASCRYATTTGVTFGSMTNSFNYRGGFLFTKDVSGHVNDTEYTYYIRCEDESGLANASDFELNFTLDDAPISNTSVVTTGAGGQGGTGPFPNGSSVLYLASVRLAGFAPPQSTVFLLKDGVQDARVTARSDGRFEYTVLNLERGTYSFSAYAIDGKNRRTALYTSSLSLSQASANSISDIVLSPTIQLARASVSLGEDVVVFGEATPGSSLEIYTTTAGEGNRISKQYAATTSLGVLGVPDGTWTFTIPGKDLAKGPYEIRARAFRTILSRSDFSRAANLGVGVDPVLNTGNRADINRDGKVNLVDFSILLSFWGTDDADADINQDGNINLADFSIMLFNWTG